MMARALGIPLDAPTIDDVLQAADQALIVSALQLLLHQRREQLAQLRGNTKPLQRRVARRDDGLHRIDRLIRQFRQ